MWLVCFIDIFSWFLTALFDSRFCRQTATMETTRAESFPLGEILLLLPLEACVQLHPFKGLMLIPLCHSSSVLSSR